MSDVLELKDNWDAHWTKYAASAEQNPAQLYRRKLIFDLLGTSTPERILDIGSGQGDFARDVQSVYPQAKLLGLELSQAGVQIAQKKMPSAEFIQRNLMEPAETPERYRGWATHAVCSEMLEHVDEPSTVLKNIAPFLQKDCRLVVTVPAGPISAFDKHIGHRRHFTKQLLKVEAERADFEVQEFYSAGFPFMNLYKLAVILRGKRLIEDVADGSGGASSPAAAFTMKVFQRLFRLNMGNTPWGWQIAAVLRLK